MSLISFDMGGPVLWEWIAVGKGLAEGHCKKQRYQTRSSITDVERMRGFLAHHYRNVEILDLKRVEIERPQAGIVSYKAYTHGIIDEVRDELARKKLDSRVFFHRSLFNVSPKYAASQMQTAPAVPGKSLLRKREITIHS
jgi:hypothetical protein